MLLYTKELVAPRPQRPVGLLRFKRHPLREKYGKMLRASFAHSTIHGMHNAFEEEHLWMRYFWLITVVIASVGFLGMVSLLEKHHNEQLLVSVVANTQLPLYSIEFPAVAICPWNHVNWVRASTAAERFLPANADRYMRETFRQLLIGMERLTFGQFETLEALSHRNLSSLSQLSLTKLASYLAYRCDELFVPESCVFDETSYDCCQLFVTEHTEKGRCLVFNSLISDESRKKKLVNEFYPFKVSKAGEQSGLQFMLRLNDSFLREGTKIPFSMNLMIKEAHQWSQPVIYHLYANTENFVAVDPTVIETSKNTYELEPEQRGCYFDDEPHTNYPYSLSALPYSRDNCIAVCLQLSVYENCKCTMPLHLPSLDGTRECGILDVPCLFNHTDVFSYVKMKGQEKYINDSRRGQLCTCPDSCNTKQYKMLLNVRQLDNTNETKQIRAEVYFGQRVITKIETKLKYTSQDWIASFGSILGLYIGASALSFAELVFIITKLLWSFIKDVYAKVTSK